MEFSFILVDPAVPENVGFCARGLTTMGFSNLRIVGERLNKEQGARNTAYGSHDLLEKIKVFETLEEAIVGHDLIIGTTAKSRLKRYDYLSPRDLKSSLNQKSSDLRVALVFGSEKNGLSSEHIDKCDLLTTIPLQTDYPSLNLAQAVLIYAYELSESQESKPASQPSEGLLEAFKTDTSELLKQLGYDRHPIMKRRILDRLMLLGSKDAELLMAVLSKLKGRLNRD